MLSISSVDPQSSSRPGWVRSAKVCTIRMAMWKPLYHMALERASEQSSVVFCEVRERSGSEYSRRRAASILIWREADMHLDLWASTASRSLSSSSMNDLWAVLLIWLLSTQAARIEWAWTSSSARKSSGRLPLVLSRTPGISEATEAIGGGSERQAARLWNLSIIERFY